MDPISFSMSSPVVWGFASVSAIFGGVWFARWRHRSDEDWIKRGKCPECRSRRLQHTAIEGRGFRTDCLDCESAWVTVPTPSSDDVADSVAVAVPHVYPETPVNPETPVDPEPTSVAGTIQMLYQFQVDGRAAGPWRRKWELAADDAVNAGYATRLARDEISFDVSGGGCIERRERIVTNSRSPE